MNENKVELIDIYGNDETIACSAWTSTSRNIDADKRNRIPKLLKDLWTNGHETPFEKVNVHFLVDTDIASHIHILKHRISSVNAESARYKELKEDKMYLPDDWKDCLLKQDMYLQDAEPFKKGVSSWYDVLEYFSDLSNRIYHIALSDIEQDLGRKRAKESARFFKTYNSQIQADVMFNMRSFANFQKLRNSEHAQKEIGEIAQGMLMLLKQDGSIKHTLEAMGL